MEPRNPGTKLAAAGFSALKRAGRRIAMLTAYDYPTAVAEAEAGIDIVLVGDSVGTNVLGYTSEREVTLDDIAHHVRAVRRGAPATHLLADLPYGTYRTPAAALENARRLVDAGADSVKFEGLRLEAVERLVGAGIPVCGHIGLEPQHHEQIGVKGKTVEDALRIVGQAKAIAGAGAFLIVLEMIPEELGALVSAEIAIPTIGIGAGRGTDGQVLVVTDLLGFNPRNYRHNRRYAELGPTIRQAIGAYRDEVEGRAFPGPENASHLSAETIQAVREALDKV